MWFEGGHGVSGFCLARVGATIRAGLAEIIRLRGIEKLFGVFLQVTLGADATNALDLITDTAGAFVT